MKRLILSAAVLFALTVSAGNISKDKKKEKAEVKTECCTAKEDKTDKACCTAEKDAKDKACCDNKEAAKKEKKTPQK